MTQPNNKAPTPPQIRGNRSGRKFSKESMTYQMFEQLFLELPEARIPLTLSNLPKGKAINLAMGLNRCHVQWAQENGLPEEMMGRSAKALPGDSEGTWSLEISSNQRRTRRGDSPAWMQALLGRIGESPLGPGADGIGGEDGGEPAPSPPWVDPQEHLLAGFLGGEEEGEKIMGGGEGEREIRGEPK